MDNQKSITNILRLMVMQGVTSTVEKASGGMIIVGFECIYDDLSRIVEEKFLADSIEKC